MQKLIVPTFIWGIESSVYSHNISCEALLGHNGASSYNDNANLLMLGAGEMMKFIILTV